MTPTARTAEDAAILCVARGKEHFDSGDFDSAIKDFKEAIRLNPQLSIAYSNLGNTLVFKGEYSRALWNLHKAIKIDPTNAHAYKALGSVYIGLEQYKRGFEYLNLAARYVPDDPVIYDNLGAGYHNQGRFNEAIAAFNKAIQLYGPNPARAIIYWKRGITHFDNRDFDLAMADFNETIKLNPGFAPAYVHRSQLHLLRDDLEEARSDLSAATRVRPELAEDAFIRKSPVSKAATVSLQEYKVLHHKDQSLYHVDPDEQRILSSALRRSVKVLKAGEKRI